MIRSMLVFFVLLAGCAHTPTMSVHVDPVLSEFEQGCMQLFRNILVIQDERAANNTLMGEVTASYSRKEITLDEHKIFFAKWHMVEAQLYTKVTSLYDEAYEDDCFKTTPAVSHIFGWQKITISD